jgi:hypothetical protein
VVAQGQETKAGEAVPFAELSTDGGASWQEAPFGSAGPGTVVTALVASGSAVTGVGSIATQQAQQPVTVSLAAG